MAIIGSANSYAGFPLGLGIANCDVTLEAHTAISKGEVVAIDPSTVSVDYRFTKTAAIAAASTGGEEIDQTDGGIVVVALEDVASGGYGSFRVQGEVTAEADGTVGAGDLCSCSAAGNGFRQSASAGDKYFAIALESGSAGNQNKFLIDGLNGFGVRHA